MAAALLLATSVADAASYASLVSQGYRAGPLSRNAAGIPGWALTGGGASYFCRTAASMAYDGRTGLVSLLSSGRRIQLDRATWEAARGGPDPSLPQLADLEAGRLRPQDVGACRRT